MLQAESTDMLFVMEQSLKFPMHQTHQRLLESLVAQANGDHEIIGIMLQGSVARGDAHLHSDLDLFMLLRDDYQRAFHSEQRGSILVECHYGNFEQTKGKIECNPMLVYGFTDGLILHDVGGILKQLVDHAQQCLAAYTASPTIKNSISHWLVSARMKMNAAREAGDVLKAAYITSTTSWTLLEALWAINNKPTPPAGAVLPHLCDLTLKPDDLSGLFESLFMGDTLTRVQTMMETIDWVVPLLTTGAVDSEHTSP
jgi:hypothetical protein